MFNFKIYVISCLLVFCWSKAQQNIQFSNDIFSGISAASFSPTQTFINPNPWDVQLFSEDFNILNDYAYISQQSLLKLPGSKIETANPKKGILGSNTANVLDFYNKDKANLFLSSDIMGPSFSMKLRVKEQDFSIGLFTRLRTQTSVKDFDNYLRFQNQEIDRPTEYFLKPLNTSFMNWGELGLNFSTNLFKNSDYEWLLGFNLKYEIGLDATNVQNLDDLKLTSVKDDLGEYITSAEQYNIKASYATNYNFESKKYELKQQGKGLGLDIGLAFINKFPDSEAYDFKVNINLLDFGYVNFQNGSNHRFVGDKKIDLDQNLAFDNVKFTSAEHFLQTLSTEVYGNANASLEAPGFKIGLPTSLHFGISKNLNTHHYLSFNWIQRWPVFENSLLRTNVMTMSYAWQKKAFAYGISSSLYEYNNLQFGGYVRFGPLIIGSDNLLPMFVSHKKLHAASFFIGFKLYPFWDDDFKRHRRQKCNCD